MSTADSLANFLSSVKNNVQKSNEERQALTDSLQAIISQAQGLLGELGAPTGTGKRRGRPAGSKNAVAGKRGPGRPKGSGKKRGRRKMSAAARKAISDAQKARWAKQKAAKK